MKLKDVYWKKNNDKPRQHIKKQGYYFAYQCLFSQSYGFSSSHVLTWELDNKKDWALKNRCLWTVVLEKNLESTLNCKEIKPVISKRNQPWIFIGSTDDEAPVLWLLDVKAGREWMTGVEIVGWHQWLNGDDFEQNLGFGDEKLSLACCSPWGRTGLRD